MKTKNYTVGWKTILSPFFCFVGSSGHEVNEKDS